MSASGPLSASPDSLSNGELAMTPTVSTPGFTVATSLGYVVEAGGTVSVSHGPGRYRPCAAGGCRNSLHSGTFCRTWQVTFSIEPSRCSSSTAPDRARASAGCSLATASPFGSASTFGPLTRIDSSLAAGLSGALILRKRCDSTPTAQPVDPPFTVSSQQASSESKVWRLI